MRLATTEDAKQIVEIYRPYCLKTNISFETKAPSTEEMKSRIEAIGSFYPFLVYEEEDSIIGYAYASNHRTRQGYQWSCESSVYIDENHHRKGIGKKLYSCLFELLTLQGLINVYAGIALPNDKSLEFHQGFGFKPVGTYEKVGFKNGAWIDVTWWQRSLNEYSDNPSQPQSIQSCNKQVLEVLERS